METRLQEGQARVKQGTSWEDIAGLQGGDDVASDSDDENGGERGGWMGGQRTDGRISG